MTKRTLLLLDVDGVLIAPSGYKCALQAALDYYAEKMGQPSFGLTLDEIAYFESLGMTNEWLAGPMCLAAILIAAGQAKPGVIRGTLDEMLAAIRTSRQSVPRPDFIALANEIITAYPIAVHEAEPHLKTLTAKLPQMQPVLDELLGDIWPPAGPVGTIIQQFTLGHTRFEQTYGLKSVLASESLLATLDRPNLSTDMSARLIGRLGNGLGASIFTARPSLPPRGVGEDDLGGLEQFNFPPEAEFAVETLGLLGTVPLIAEGRTMWLEAQFGKVRGSYIKPSPVQALAAIGAALSHDERAALLAAGALVEQGEVISPLSELAGSETRVVVVEDSKSGMLSVRQAVEMLRAHGLDVTFEAVGVATEESKREALARVADRVESTLDEALEPYLS